jgi:hypothetical protein
MAPVGGPDPPTPPVQEADPRSDTTLRGLDHFWKWPEGWQLKRVVSPFFDSVIEDDGVLFFPYKILSSA